MARASASSGVAPALPRRASSRAIRAVSYSAIACVEMRERALDALVRRADRERRATPRHPRPSPDRRAGCRRRRSSRRTSDRISSCASGRSGRSRHRARPRRAGSPRAGSGCCTRRSRLDARTTRSACPPTFTAIGRDGCSRSRSATRVHSGAAGVSDSSGIADFRRKVPRADPSRRRARRPRVDGKTRTPRRACASPRGPRCRSKGCRRRARRFPQRDSH